MGEDLTQEFILPEKPEEEQQEEEQKEVKTEEALKPFAKVIDKGTAFFINRIIQLTGEKYQVPVREQDKVKPEEIEELGFGEAVVKVIDYYMPSVPVDHPLIGLAAVGMMVGTVAWMKIEQVKARAKKEKKEEKQEEKEEIPEVPTTADVENLESTVNFDVNTFYAGRGS
ncbi:MAG: hypothetical protein H0Z19_08465 [Archaeoglobus sp.]|uniref:hypothetical protein n=1 Tax=Archaeoglobus sp. TaxID=1872626 RepID=UPI001DE0ED01|nr:hypothetical protein [Archaeoglobus sp.]MBO8180493.1 hypothetical protein [Archaeoglobus sp.]